MHLVDHHEPHADRPERPDERLLPQALGRGVEKARVAGGDRREPRRRLFGVERRVDERRRRPDLRGQLVDLVLHQRDQRREDERGGGSQHRRELVCQRLASARRHDRERVGAVEGGTDHRLLSGSEAVEAEELPKRGAEIGHPNECTGGVGANLCRLRAERLAQESETGADAITGLPVGAEAPPSSSTVTATTEPFPTLPSTGIASVPLPGANRPPETGRPSSITQT